MDFKGVPVAVKHNVVVMVAHSGHAAAYAADPHTDHRSTDQPEHDENNEEYASAHVVAIRSAVLGLQTVEEHTTLAVSRCSASGTVGYTARGAAGFSAAEEIAELALAAGGSS